MNEEHRTLKNRWEGKSQASDTRYKVPGLKTEKSSPSHGNDNEQSSAEPISKYFGIDINNYVPSCLFSKNNGHRYIMPYSHLPDIEILPDEQEKLVIRSTRRTIILHGVYFDELMNWLANYQVKWITESATAISESSERLFIKEIEFIMPEEEDELPF